jgi:hypothetical protein
VHYIKYIIIVEKASMMSHFARTIIPFVAAALLLLSTSSQAYSVSQSKMKPRDKNQVLNRRTAVAKFLSVSTAVGAGVLLSSSSPAEASGGATAGKYT